MPDHVPAELRSFLAENIESVAQLELLLLLRSDAARTWSVSDAAKALYMAEEMTAPLLADLRVRGLLANSAGGEYQYSPRSPEQEQLVKELALLYQERRVTVIGLIHSAPTDVLRSFADAFRLRDPKKEP
jgi:hypothetical protein